MDQQFDSVDSNAPAPLLFQTESDDSDDQHQNGNGVNIKEPNSHRGEPKLSLSKYQYVKSFSSSGEQNDTNQEQTTPYGANQAEHIHALVHVQNGEHISKTSTPLRLPVDIRSHDVNVGVSPVLRRGSGSSSSHSTEESGRESKPCVILNPKDIRVPLVGFEVMEQRSRFTIFKLHVHKGNHDNWFIFRRYTDFVQLQKKLKKLFPMFRLPLPPKRWFLDNYEQNFLEDRLHGLQAFIDSVLCHTGLCNCPPVQEFFCFNDPPGPHDSVEESRAYCEDLEDAVYSLKKDLREKDAEMDLLRDELSLYKSQVEMLTQALRAKNTNGATNTTLPSPANSLAECDLMAPEADQSLPSTQCIEVNQSKPRIPAEQPIVLEQTQVSREQSRASKKVVRNTKQEKEKEQNRKHSGIFKVLSAIES